MQPTGVASEFAALAAGETERWDLKSADGAESIEVTELPGCGYGATPATSMFVAATSAAVPPIEAPTRMIRFAPRRSSSAGPGHHVVVERSRS